jgi:2-polyprenyl-3-methyl-5-hydroxy-6-metoxy-1,4-benzoquinol methylase
MRIMPRMQRLSELAAEQIQEIITQIAPDDPDCQSEVERDHYFAVGRSALENIRAAMLIAGTDDPARILDLPCGYGRVLRALKAAFPEAELAACDIVREAVDFCAETFGAEPVYAHEDPAETETEVDQPYDLIWCNSLLTHVNQSRWAGFLRLFEAVAAPGGIVVFTTCGRQVADRLRTGVYDYDLNEERIEALLSQYEREGFGYQDYPDVVASYFAFTESDGYGLSLSTPAFVCSQLEAVPSLRLLAYTEQGADQHLDVVACLKTTGG